MHWYLFPFAILYGIGVSFRNILFDLHIFKSKQFKTPVVSVGNLAVGGTGKTPHTEFILKYLQEEKKIAVLSRGYKRKTKGYFEVKTKSKASESGDEPLQMKRKFNHVQVVVDEDRVHGIETLLQQPKKPEVIVLDDAYQHRKVKPGYSILLTDYSRLFTKDFLMPVGRLREGEHNKKRANCIVVTKCPNNLKPLDYRILKKELDLYPFQSLYFTTFTYLHIVPFHLKKEEKSLKELKDRQVILVTGIANPKSLYRKLESKGAILHKMAFPDHHHFSKKDLEQIAAKYKSLKDKKPLVLCTEKDATRIKEQVKESALAQIPLYYLPIEVKFLNGGKEEFLSELKKAITP